ncbi:MAG: excinuclease ABC subunit UvrA [Verrucomicrobiota bacterium]|nr:excinuclease ABC subunit UvrA [Verrucomicrobiota bacterium]
MSSITLRNVLVHNLKGVSLTIPQGKLVLFTGLSGSGKSSLAFDTIYVEGQRRYIESLPTKPGHLLRLHKPEAAEISGIAPTVAIEQKMAARTPRSTVGTLTGIYDFLRVLYARLGTPYCPISKEPVSAQSREQIIYRIQSLPEKSKTVILAPYAQAKKGEGELQELMRKGFLRLRIDGAWVDLSESLHLEEKMAHTIDVVIDRVQVTKETFPRLAESLQLALEMGGGVCSIYFPDSQEELTFSETAFSPKSGKSYPPLSPHDFSFNHPLGWCPLCQGLGEKEEMPCPECHGRRIKPYPAATKLFGRTITEIVRLPLDDLSSFLEGLSLTSVEEAIGGEMLKEIREELRFLLHVGLGYLSLDRSAPSLSGGESQRVRLAAQIGAGLVGAIYVLDEPSIGLHATDHHRLIETLFSLRDQGNSLLVVEHDEETIRAADWIVDVGPGAGKEGGEILFTGPLEKLLQSPKSLTGAYLSGKKKIEIPKKKRKPKEFLTIVDATHHNLRNVTVEIPLHLFTCVTGVSGSGKSSLISDVLFPALAKALHRAKLPVGAHKKIVGWEKLEKVIAVDQSPIGRTPRSNAATYIKLFDDIRDLFSELPESRLRGFNASHFSFNVPEGTCPYCQGLGSVAIDLDRFEEAQEVCPQCLGSRFTPEVLTIRFKGKTIREVLECDVNEALLLFADLPKLREKLQVLQEVGLGYLKLGQPSTTLSGGEAQRVKLARELVRPSSGETLYLLDEPTTGLHFEDVKRLLSVLQKLTDRGNSVLVIEHNLELIRSADWVIDLGPGAGIRGGNLLAAAPPEKIATLDSPTGRALRGELPLLQQSSLKTKEQNDAIVVENGKENNLQSVSVEIPRGKISLFTGPSGSGKSSLAFDTLYAEGQRRYVETLSPYLRSMLPQLAKPKAERISGLPPSIALEQKRGGLNPRSTVGTLTEIYDLFRLLFAHLGEAFCPETGERIRHISKQWVVDRLLQLPEERIAILAPISAKKERKALQEEWLRLGFLRIRLNGVFYALDEEIPWIRGRKEELFLVIDRLTPTSQNSQRLYEAIDQADKLSRGLIAVAREKKEDLLFNLSFAVETTGKSYPPLTPQTFSFNHDSGMCPECQGLGVTYGLSRAHPELLPLSLSELTEELFGELGTKTSLRIVEEYWEKQGVNPHAPLETLSDAALEKIFHGAPLQESSLGLQLQWAGLTPLFAAIARMGKREWRDSFLPLMATTPCVSCEGSRLNALARHVKLQGRTLPSLCKESLAALPPFLQTLSLEKAPFLQEAYAQICNSLDLLLSLGLGYLSLDRSAPGLSGGEWQRIRLAKQLGTGLTSCLYVLDEPTLGLHPDNNADLHVALKSLAAKGNTLLLVEHDPMTMRIADQIFDFGPKAGREGGKICASGTLSEILQNENSVTGRYLSGKEKISIPAKRRAFQSGLQIAGAKLHTLKNLSLTIPQGIITCITGVSGAGKSTLMCDLIQPAMGKCLQNRRPPDTIEYEGTHFSGCSQFRRLVVVDASPFGQTSRADVGSFAEIMPLVRAHFAELPFARARGLRGAHFSPNHLRGMCRTCWGLGYKMVNLQFLPSVRVTCEGCRGFRLNPLSLEVRYKGKHFGDLFSFTIAEARSFFSDLPKLALRLQMLEEVGLSYLQLGQEIASLSGGELQRLRLAKELGKRETGQTLYLIDEPTVGLHFSDIAKLLPILHRLADHGNTLLIIEHNLDLIANADYLIDLGPGAGPEGGEIVAQGTPEGVALSNSRLAPYLRERLAEN